MNQMTISFKTKTGMTNIRHNNRDLSEEEIQSNNTSILIVHCPTKNIIDVIKHCL